MSQDYIYNSSRRLLCKHEEILSRDYNHTQNQYSIINFEKPSISENNFIGSSYMLAPINECRVFKTRGENNIRKDYDQTIHKHSVNHKHFLNLTKSRDYVDQDTHKIEKQTRAFMSCARCYNLR